MIINTENELVKIKISSNRTWSTYLIASQFKRGMDTIGLGQDKWDIVMLTKLKSITFNFFLFFWHHIQIFK